MDATQVDSGQWTGPGGEGSQEEPEANGGWGVRR